MQVGWYRRNSQFSSTARVLAKRQRGCASARAHVLGQVQITATARPWNATELQLVRAASSTLTGVIRLI
jgi:hypothetical protein